MVDLGKKKGGKGKKENSDESTKKRDSVKETSSSGDGTGSSKDLSTSDVDTSPFEMPDDTKDNYEGVSVSDTSRKLSGDGAELNYHAETGEGEKEYVKRQVKECKEFYDDYVENAKQNLTDINEFTLIHHALMISLARNRIGIADVLMDRFDYPESKAYKKVGVITQKAGETDALREILSEMTEKMAQG
jgi:hypothetical protein